MGSWWEKRRPAPLDVFTPAMQWGRFRTWIEAVLYRSELRTNTANAWMVYATLLKKIKSSWSHVSGRSNRMGRFARHVLAQQGSHQDVRYLEIGAFEGASVAFVHALLEGRLSITVVDPFSENPELP